MTMSTKFGRIAAAKALSGSVMLCLVGAPGVAWAQDQELRNENPDEIIVTAQKREQLLSDVPVPVTAIGGGDLIAQNQTKVEEFFASVPGVNLQFQNNRSQLAIRGITTGPVSGNPVVGYTIDDAPFGGATSQGGLFGSAPDLDPSELARVEVLRGPQGTLYGAASMGGLVKYVLVKPDLGAFGGSVAGGLSWTKRSSEVGYNLRGAINVPVSDTLAIRASGYTRKEAGYIDNVRTGESDVNSSRVSGGRLAALWEPTDGISLDLNALYQVRNIYGSSNVDSTTGSFYQQTDMPGTGRSRSETQMYTATFNADLGGVDLTSITSYSRAQSYDNLDFTASPLVEFAPIFPTLFPDQPGLGDLFYQEYNVDKWTHETRLAGSFGDSVDWIVGGFYTKENGDYSLDNSAIDPVTGDTVGVPIDDGTGPQLGTIIVWRDKIKFEEYAAFANVDLILSERFDIQVGGRYSHNDQSMDHNDWFQYDPYPAPAFPSTNQPKASGSAFTYQVSPRFKPTPDHMVYARVASGYRPGGPNAICGPLALPFDVPCEFKPDKTVNYELGAKGDLADGALSYDVSLFHIDWTDIQIVQVLDVFVYNGNAGKARSRGVELGLTARPMDGLTISGWYAYVDATLREAVEDANFFAREDDRLPFSSEHSARLSIDYEFFPSSSIEARIGGSATYVGDRKGEFVPFEGVYDLRQNYPSYTQFDLYASATMGQFTLSGFVQNVTNKHGVIGGGFWNQTTYNANWFNYARPRTIGFNAEMKF